MPANESVAVRPTKRALGDLGIRVPNADTLLHELEHACVSDAQRLPEIVLAQSAERIVSISDRVWFKCRSGDSRSAIVRLRDGEVFPGIRHEDWLGRWWIGAAGDRADDSPQHDFYSKLSVECRRNGTSMHLLPTDWDENRLKLELGALFERRVRNSVLDAVALSLKIERGVRMRAANHYFQAYVSPNSQDEVYLFVGAGGIYNAAVLAVMLSAIPGVKVEDWQPEPSGEQHGADPQSGEIVYSTLLPEEAVAELRSRDLSGFDPEKPVA